MKLNKRFIKDCMQILFAIFLMGAICPQKAFAYLDPGTGSMILQVILAGIVGLGCTMKVWKDKILHSLKRIKMENNKPVVFEPSSFKDPDARVFYKDGDVYRKISKKYAETYKKFMDSGLYEKLVSKNLIVKHEEITEDSEITIKPEKVFISYPYEWCFSEIKDAALTTLEIQKTALEYDMTLKDATPFNIQFLNNSPVFN